MPFSRHGDSAPSEHADIPGVASSPSSRGRLLLLSYHVPPEPNPLAVGLKGVLDALRDTWTIDVVTATENAYAPPGVTTHHVPPRSLKGLHRTLGRVRLGKLADLVTWPDPYWPWIWPALRTSTRIVEAQRPDAVLAFSMPFSSAILGTLLKARTGLPLVLNFNDSPTCSDMYPVYPSRLHYERSRWLEDQFARRADRVVYVSKTNRDRVAARQPKAIQHKVELVRCSAIPPNDEANPPPPPAPSSLSSSPPTLLLWTETVCCTLAVAPLSSVTVSSTV